MVRVLTAHHFASQDIQTSEEPVAIAAVPPDKLLIATSTCIVEVRDLSDAGAVISSFSTADLVQQMVYSNKGNYVASLEGIYVRVYVNWETGIPPMRARIAGRVTPSISQGESRTLEMVELPINAASTIACCQTTGNILVASHRSVTIFHFLIRTHDASRTRFIDFEESTISLSLSFTPSKTFLCEEVMVFMNKYCLLVCKMQLASQSCGSKVHSNLPRKQSVKVLNLEEILRLEREVSSGLRTAEDIGISLPVTILLPAVAAERASKGHSSPTNGVINHNSPFVADPVGVSATVSNSRDCLYERQLLLCLQLAGDPQGGHSEEFRCLAFQPLYRRSGTSNNKTRKKMPLCSQHRNLLSGFAVFIATHQEGFLYQFSMDESENTHQPCVTVYHFTAPVSSVILEPYAVHALTETGLETYTQRSSHHTLRELQGVSPPPEEPICLIGLRPFIGVRHLISVGHHLVLLATSDGSPLNDGVTKDPWTLYSLKLPRPEVLSADMTAVGESHRIASPSTYYSLLGEAHCVLSTARLLTSLPNQPRKEDEGALEALYFESCAHLGDFLIVSDDSVDRDLATQYYCMSRMPATRILDRIKRFVNHREEGELSQTLTEDELLRRSQLHFLTNKVVAPEEKDEQELRQLAGLLLDFLETQNLEHHLHELDQIVLRAKIVREYCAQRTLSLIRRLRQKSTESASTVLALLVLEVQQGEKQVALEDLQSINSESLVKELSTHWNLLVDTVDRINGSPRGWSEVAAVLMERRPAEMATLLFQLVMSETLSLALVLKMMLDFLSTRIGTAGAVVGMVFQRFLELYFDTLYKSHSKDVPMDLATEEALKILVRSYLSDLQNSGGCTTTPASVPSSIVLLESERLSFLDAMPPFAPDLSERLAFPVGQSSPVKSPVSASKVLSLKKLQAMLSSELPRRVCGDEVLMFVRGQPKVYGNLSLQVLCLPPDEAAILLLDFCPQAVLPYAKDTFHKEEDWKQLLVSLNQKVDTQEQVHALHVLYQQTISDILDHLAHNMDENALGRVLGAIKEENDEDGIADFDLPLIRAHQAYFDICRRMRVSKVILNLIQNYATNALEPVD